MNGAEGFRVAEVPVKHHARKYGKSRYGLERILRGYLRNRNVAEIRYYAPPSVGEAVKRAARVTGADCILELAPLPAPAERATP